MRITKLFRNHRLLLFIQVGGNCYRSRWWHRGSCLARETAVPGSILGCRLKFLFQSSNRFSTSDSMTRILDFGLYLTFFCTACQYQTKPLPSFFLLNTCAKLCKVNKRSLISLHVYLFTINVSVCIQLSRWNRCCSFPMEAEKIVVVEGG